MTALDCLWTLLTVNCHRNVPVLESYNGRRTEETLQSVGCFLNVAKVALQLKR